MRRRLVLVFAILLVTVVPLSASAASSTAQTFTLTSDILSVTGPCMDRIAIGGSVAGSAAAGVVNDTGPFVFDIGSDGPFPNQVVGSVFFDGAHSSAKLEYTGTLRCPDSQTYIINGQVWTGDMYDAATGKWYSISGAGRGNSITVTVGPNGLSATFTGTAKLLQGPPVKHAE
jgi:hypothetical protein